MPIIGGANQTLIAAQAYTDAEKARAQGVEATLPTTYEPLTYPAYVATKNRPNVLRGGISVYNRKASNTRRIRAGLGRAASGGHSLHAVIGDSMGAGCTQGITAPYGFDRFSAWPISMRNEIARNGIPIAGTGWIPTSDGGIVIDPRLTYSGSWNSATNYIWTAAGGDTMTLTPDMGGTMLSIWVYDPGGGLGTYDFTVKQNGTLIASLSSIAGPAGFRMRNITGTFKAGDTILFTAGANGFYPGGFRIWSPGQGGIEVFNIAQSGSKATGTGGHSWGDITTLNALGLDWIPSISHSRTVTDGVFTSGSNILSSATANYDEKDLGRQVFLPAGGGVAMLPNNYAIITGVTDSSHVTLSQNATANATGATVQIGADPDAVHIALGYNDLTSGQTGAATVAAITTIAGMFPYSDIVLHVYAQPTTGFIAAATFDAYVSLLYDLADTLNCVLFDHRDRQGTHTDLVNTRTTGDNLVHQNSASYQALGRAIALALLD
jgi:hypothetical protein